jgi:hypothetical protein
MDEISRSKKTLESLVNRPVESFAYPYGRPGDFGKETVALVRHAGFDYACTNVSGAVAPDSDPYLLPRLFVRDVDGETFGRWLSQWVPV